MGMPDPNLMNDSPCASGQWQGDLGLTYHLAVNSKPVLSNEMPWAYVTLCHPL